jgi:putative FmdB family regulatory protein
MPIYEFYCEPCHTIYQFFSRSMQNTRVPACPKCSGALRREVSLFAITGKAKEEGDPEDLPIDEAKMESAMMQLASQAENMNEDDPRQAAQLMRRFSEMTGMELGDTMQEAMARMEAGEDPDAVEADLGDKLDAEDPLDMFGTKQSGGLRRAILRGPVKRDPKLYDM